jgi:hypothetical protein
MTYRGIPIHRELATAYRVLDVLIRIQVDGEGGSEGKAK